MFRQDIRSGQNALRRGFTLMEVIVVAAIIVILAGAGTVVYTRMIENAKKTQAEMEIKNIETAIVSFQSQYKRDPTSVDDLYETSLTDSNKPLIPFELQRDPWSQLYQIDCSGAHNRGQKPDVWSQGPPGDGVEIGNWPKN